MTGFFMAWGMFCAIPCPRRVWKSEKYPQMLLSLPLIGLLIGALWALADWALTAWGGAGLLGAALLCVLPSLLSGFIHLDGYMDCADALLSRRDLETRRRILKDSHVGAFAVIALALWLLFGFASFASVTGERRALCLLFLPAAVRSVSAAAVLHFAPMSSSGYAALPQSVKGHHRLLALGEALLFCALAVLCCGLSGLSCLLAAAVSAAVILLLRRNLGGMSGDISGCAITLGELFGVMVLVFL